MSARQLPIVLHRAPRVLHALPVVLGARSRPTRADVVLQVVRIDRALALARQHVVA
ncbi:MAG: hypothetical protein ABSB49_10220 [Polyangia bacterium]